MQKDNGEESKRLESGKKWFDWYVDQLDRNSVQANEEGIAYKCPCCGYKTLDERGGYDICSVCFWEDDGQDNHDAHIIRGGPNGFLSLTQARENYKNFSACEERFITKVRSPKPVEM